YVQTADKRRYRHREIVCKHRGKPRKGAPGSTEKKSRKSSSKQVGCPFKIIFTWPVAATTPTITSSNCDHNHDPAEPSQASKRTCFRFRSSKAGWMTYGGGPRRTSKRQGSSNCSGW
ncbi:unnamed protein product, partial [Pylaiella littoralis]